VLLTGSGPHDRDESLMGQCRFLVLADYLTRQGIAALRADAADGWSRGDRRRTPDAARYCCAVIGGRSAVWGWLLATIGSRYGPWIGMAASSLLFGRPHSLNPNATVLGLAFLSLFGAFLELYALAEGGLWGACAWHALWNWTDSNLFGLGDSGGPPHPALLVSIKPGGMDIITGGAFGPDGGLIDHTGIRPSFRRYIADARRRSFDRGWDAAHR
jgi:hypothetical protein